MRLTRDVPGATHVTVLLDGVEQKRCFAADDILGVALCEVHDANGHPIAATLHRDWQVGEFDREGIVVRWVPGTVAFHFDQEDERAQAEAYWEGFIVHDALWALADVIAARGGTS